MLDPYDAREAGRDFTIADQRTYILVIETETGKTVRTEEVKGLILGQVLTNDTLAVETSQAYYPGGNGHGTITTYSLDKPTAKAATISTDKWLVGATQDSLLLAPSNMSQGHFGSQPLTRLSEGGAIAGGTSRLIDVVRTTWRGGVDLVDAVYAASVQGARILGDDSVGALEAGCWGDVVVTDADLVPVDVLRRGEPVA